MNFSYSKRSETSRQIATRTYIAHRNRVESEIVDDWREIGTRERAHVRPRSKNDPRGGVNDQIGQLVLADTSTRGLARSNNVSVHARTEASSRSHEWCARTRVWKRVLPFHGIFFTFASAAKRRGRAYITPCTYTTSYIHIYIHTIYCFSPTMWSLCCARTSLQTSVLPRCCRDLSKIITVSRGFDIANSNVKCSVRLSAENFSELERTIVYLCTFGIGI